jgi:hypothetical protein
MSKVLGVICSFIDFRNDHSVTIASPSQSAKKRLKAILNLDKFVEMLIIVFNFGRLTLFPSKYTPPREIYIARIRCIPSFFILQSKAFTRLTWCVLGSVCYIMNVV